MNTQILKILSLVLAILFGVGAVAVAAQGTKKMGGGMMMDMAAMKNDPHHKLMMAYAKNMSDFAMMLRDQALTPKGPDIDFARAVVAQLRHDFDSMEAIRMKHMDTMSPEMKAKMKMMMDKMEKGQAMVKEHIVALETLVKADMPDAKQVAVHANDLVKQFAMMSNMEGKPMTGKKMPVKKKTTRKKMIMKMKPM